MNIYVSHSSSYDFETELYDPLRQLSPDHTLYFPHTGENEGSYSKPIISGSDVVLAEVSHSSSGQGIELGWADAMGVPIVCFYRNDATVSKALAIICTEFITYTSTDEMLSLVRARLESMHHGA